MKNIDLDEENLVLLKKYLNKMSFFSSVSPLDLSKIMDNFEKLSFEKGEIIFKQGETGNSFYIVIEGAIDINRKLLGLISYGHYVLKEGEFFGEMALVEHKTRNATATAKTACTLFTLKSPSVHDLINGNLSFKDALTQLIETRRARKRAH